MVIAPSTARSSISTIPKPHNPETSTNVSSRRFPSPSSNHRPSTPPSIPQTTSTRRSYSVDRTRFTTRSLSVSFQGESFFYQTSKAKTDSPKPERRRTATPTRNSALLALDKSSHQAAARSGGSNLMTKSLDCASDKDLMTMFQGDSLFYKTSKAKTDSPTPERRRTATPTRNSALLTFEKSSHRAAARSGRSNLLTKSLDCSSDKDSIARHCIVDGADFSVSSDTDSLSSGSNPGTPESRFRTRASLSQETNGRVRSLPGRGMPLSSLSSKSSVPLKTARRSPSCSSKVGGSQCRGNSSPLRGRGNGVLSNACSIASFAAEMRRRKKGVSHVEEVHMLRVLYNKQLHWRHVNARASAALLIQRVSAEKKMHNAWITSSKLYDLVTVEKIKLQLLTQQLKQAIVLKGQMIYLEEWFNLESDHSCSLSRAIEALKACTIHLPVVNGARAELKDIKYAVGSAIDVMQAMGASICSLLPKVESMSSFSSQLSKVVARERELIQQSRDLLSTVAALHVKQCSLRGQLLQLKHGLRFVQP